jgi:hydrogenase maturation protease
VTLSRRLAVVCLGNPIMGDDAFGILVARRLEGLEGADLLVSEGGGMETAEGLLGYKEALLIDSVEVAEGKVGDLILVPLEELSALTGPGGHSLGLPHAFEALKLMSSDVPKKVDVLACLIRPVEAFGDEVSPAVKRAVPRCASLARRWVSARRKSRSSRTRSEGASP